LRREPTPGPSVELVIFDCDGVLVDSERVGAQVDRRVLADLGWELDTDEIVDRFLGCTEAAFQAAVEQHLGRPLPQGWAAPYERWYEQAYVDELVTIDGIEEALDALDLPTCVASNSPHAKLHRSLALTGLLDRFDGRLFSSDDVARGKPAPDLYLHAAEVMGVDPTRCVVVEDSRTGTTAALAAGMRVLGYAGGLTPAAWLGELGATVFEDMREVPGLVDGLR
jgi:HAD superfamily hydrolase (TIGR01509 family)